MIALKLPGKERPTTNDCSFSKDHKCLKWTDYELTRHELEEIKEKIEAQKETVFILENQNFIRMSYWTYCLTKWWFMQTRSQNRDGSLRTEATKEECISFW